MKIISRAVVLSALIAAPAFAQDAAPQSGTYEFDPAHSEILFSYNHLGFSDSVGLIRNVAGTIVLDAENPENSTVEARFPLSNVITPDQKLDDELPGDQFFKVEDASQTMITFKSTKVELDEDGDEAKVTGDLTMNNMTAPVTLDIELKKAGTNPMTSTAAVGFTGEAEFMRSAFGLDAYVPNVSDKLDIDLNVEAMLKQ